MAKTPTATDTASAAKKPAARKPKAAAAAPVTAGVPEAKAKFSQAIEDARAGAKALTAEAQARAGEYKDQLAAKSGDWVDEAKDLAGQARERATELAHDGKAKASDAIGTLGQLVADSAPTIDEKLGAKYGDYARTAARSMQETAAKIESKELVELGEDAKEFVRKSPGLAIGLAAVAGFLISRLFKGGSSNN
ncbi:hypothetical protein [Novosphingobium sp.]|uniref:hypothetical protein n=1 Tax=Novosphingobium sp. TaxID=1874826 RepID=UPI002732D789|nr:hypothetical protein [Novosphingobium sp.]MDP3907096.1 hypothetical protein [Novosphingobium sp.]